MQRGVRLSLGGLTLLIALAGCGRGMWQYGERASWRHEAEVSCLKSGAVKIGSGVVQIQPIEGPGVCGADFPLKVSALGEGGVPMAYGDDLRPPAGIPNASPTNMPRWPASQPSYAPPPPPQPMSAPAAGEHMQWQVGPQGIDQSAGAPPQPAYQQQPDYQPPQQQTYQPQPAYRPPQQTYQQQPAYQPAPAGAPMSIQPPDAEEADDIPDDAILPGDPKAPAISRPQSQQAARPPYQPPQQQTPPALGPQRAPAAAATQASLTPAATLACPLVSALDRWVSEGVQPAALHWFRQPVVSIKQISAYSCRDMVGNSSAHISEHAFGNALDVAAFTLADGRTISVQHGWHGSPEEQGFLHDVQLYACQTFTTVLAPGYNAAHYNHIHVDLMRRASGRTPCRPNAVPGEVVAAKARAHYAAKGAPAYTGSIPKKYDSIDDVLAGADGLYDDDEDASDAPAKPEPVKKSKSLFNFSGWSLFGKSSVSGGAPPDPSAAASH
jgi:hypothetical protein